MSARKRPGDEIVLSYHDCLLRREDVDLLRGPHWLNDAIIGFYFEYLDHKFNNAESNSNEILFISPEFTQLLKLTDSSEYSSLLDSSNATQRSYILFPLNNCESRDTVGGSHWSLLVYSKKDETCFHFDSCRGMNRSVASPFARKILNYLSDSGAKNFEEMDCPQQENGYDCGLFTLCFADIIFKSVGTSPKIRECNFSGVRSIVRTKREEILDLIEELKSIDKPKK